MRCERLYVNGIWQLSYHQSNCWLNQCYQITTLNAFGFLLFRFFFLYLTSTDAPAFELKETSAWTSLKTRVLCVHGSIFKHVINPSSRCDENTINISSDNSKTPMTVLLKVSITISFKVLKSGPNKRVLTFKLDSFPPVMQTN